MQLRKITNSMEMSLYQREVMGINGIAKECLNLTLKQLNEEEDGKVIVLVPKELGSKLIDLINPLGSIDISVVAYNRIETEAGLELSKEVVSDCGPIKHLYGFI